GRDEAQAQHADILAMRERLLVEDLAPREHRVAGEERVDVPPAIDRRDRERVRQAIERNRPRQAYHMAAIDEPAAEAALAFDELIEMHSRRVLIEPRRHHVFGFFDCNAVAMVDL